MGSSTSVTQEIETIKKWLDILSDWRSSKLTVPAYCKAHGLTPSTFYKWKNRHDAGILILPVAKKEEGPADFVPVTIKSALNPPSPSSTSSASSYFNIRLPKGIVIELNDDALTPAVSSFVTQLLGV